MCTNADKAKLCPFGPQRAAPAISSWLHYRHFAQHIRKCSKAGGEYTKSSTLSSFPQCHVMHILCQGALKAKGIRNAWLGSWVSSAPYFFSSSPTFVSLQGRGQKKRRSSSIKTSPLLFHILRLFQISSWAKIWQLTIKRAHVCDHQHSVWSEQLGGIHFAAFTRLHTRCNILPSKHPGWRLHGRRVQPHLALFHLSSSWKEAFEKTEVTQGSLLSRTTYKLREFLCLNFPVLLFLPPPGVNILF